MTLINNLFKILKKEENYYLIQLANKEHQVFKAHFKDNEILPGFLQIDIIADLNSHEIISIIKAKFIKILKPDDIISYNISSKDQKRFKVIIKKETSKVSEIIYEI